MPNAQDPFNPWLPQLANNISSTLMQLPQMRAQTQLRQAQMGSYDANAQQSMAQARHYDARTAALQSEEMAAGELGNSLGGVFRAIQSGDTNAQDQAGADTMIAAGKLAKRNPERAGKMLGEMLMKVQGARSNDPREKFANFSGKAPPNNSSVNSEELIAATQSAERRSQMGADARVEAATISAAKSVPLRTDQSLVNPTTGDTISEAIRQWGIGTPGAWVIGADGKPMEKIPSAANPSSIDPGKRAILSALGQRYADAVAGNDTKNMRLMEAEMQRVMGGGGAVNPPGQQPVIRMTRDASGKLIPVTQ